MPRSEDMLCSEPDCSELVMVPNVRCAEHHRAYALAGLSVRELLIGDVARLAHVERWGTTARVHPDTVAAHSFYVAFYAMTLGQWLLSRSQSNYPSCPDMAVLLQRALMHDVDESISSDLPRDFKHSNEDLLEVVRIVSVSVCSGIVSRLMGHQTTAAYSLYKSWRHAKADDIEGAIIEFADFLAAVSYLWQELNVSNATVYRHYKTTQEQLETFKTPRFDFLRPVVDEVTVIVERLMQAAKERQVL